MRNWGLSMLVSALILDMGTRCYSDALNRRVDIPAGDLSQSLAQLSRQLGIQILFDADRLKGMKSGAVAGPLSPKQAIDRLLIGTSLQVEEEGSDSFLIIPEPAQVSKPTPPAPERTKTTTNVELEEVTVTGTHIRGETPVGASLSTYDRDDFNRLGVATVDNLGRYMLENFSGADSLSTLNTNGNVGSLQQGAATNTFGGASFDLLGLGTGATLTLLDGHRIAPGGLDGSMVDVSLIPLSAIDHIEVLTDGAAAQYGTDAIAGVVNIVTRRPLEGADTSIRYGQSTEKGAGQLLGSQTFGHAWSSGNVFLDYEYKDEQGLDASERSWIGPENGPYSLLPENHRHSFFASGTQSLEATQFSFSGLYSTRGFQLNGLQLSTSGLVPNSEVGGGHANLAWAAVSVDRDLPAAWHVSSAATYSGMNQWRSGEDFPNGLGGNHFNSALLADSALEGIDLSASGRVLRLPAGALRVAFGGGFRSETFVGSVPSIEPLPIASGNRTDLNAYAEATLPIFGDDFSFPGMHRFETSFAYRVDSYNHFGAPANSKWGWDWEIDRRLTFRGSLGTSFKAPLLSQIEAPTTSFTSLLPGGTAGDKPIDALVINGGSQYLIPETSRTFTSGFDWAPIRWPRFRTSVTYFSVTYTNRIQSQTTLPQLASLASPSLGLNQVLPLFQAPGFQQDGAGLGPSGVTEIIDNRLANAGRTLEQGIRMDAQYLYDDDALGQWRFSISGNYLLLDDTTLQNYFPQIANFTNTIAEPAKFRLRGAIIWQYHDLTTDVMLNHTSAYENTLFSPAQGVSSWTTADLNLQLNIPNYMSPLWRDLSVVLNVQNLADRRPPYLSIPAGDIAIGRSPVPFDGTNASALGRYVSFEVRKAWR